MSGQDVLRERIARALWEESGGLPEWDAVPTDRRVHSGSYEMADAVAEALELEEIIDDVSVPGRVWRRYVTPLERIEEGK